MLFCSFSLGGLFGGPLEKKIVLKTQFSSADIHQLKFWQHPSTLHLSGLMPLKENDSIDISHVIYLFLISFCRVCVYGCEREKVINILAATSRLMCHTFLCFITFVGNITMLDDAFYWLYVGFIFFLPSRVSRLLFSSPDLRILRLPSRNALSTSNVRHCTKHSQHSFLCPV